MTGLELKYFVLKPKSGGVGDPYARASRQAMRIYADSIEDTNYQLAFDLRVWASDEDKAAVKLMDSIGAAA